LSDRRCPPAVFLETIGLFFEAFFFQFIKSFVVLFKLDDFEIAEFENLFYEFVSVVL
jgi:hypothetical protein